MKPEMVEVPACDVRPGDTLDECRVAITVIWDKGQSVKIMRATVDLEIDPNMGLLRHTYRGLEATHHKDDDPIRVIRTTP